MHPSYTCWRTKLQELTALCQYFSEVFNCVCVKQKRSLNYWSALNLLCISWLLKCNTTTRAKVQQQSYGETNKCHRNVLMLKGKVCPNKSLPIRFSSHSYIMPFQRCKLKRHNKEHLSGCQMMKYFASTLIWSPFDFSWNISRKGGENGSDKNDTKVTQKLHKWRVVPVERAVARAGGLGVAHRSRGSTCIGKTLGKHWKTFGNAPTPGQVPISHLSKCTIYLLYLCRPLEMVVYFLCCSRSS